MNLEEILKDMAENMSIEDIAKLPDLFGYDIDNL